MALYSRQQLVLLLLLLAAAGVGLAVRQWRAAYPELAERAERVDRAPVARSESASRPPEKSGRSTPAVAEPPLDLNRATVDELTRLPGVGSAMATRIVQARESSGRFASVDDLRRVKGVGAARLDRLRPLLTVIE